MKFLILTQYFAPEIGASQVRLGSLCRELAIAGHSVEVVTAMPHHPEGRISRPYRGLFYLRDEWEGLPVHRVWLYAASGSNLKRILSYLSFCFTCFFGLARAAKPDYVFVDSPPLFLGVPGWMAAKWWRVPFVFNIADLWPDSARDLGILKDGPAIRFAYLLERWLYRHSNYVTAVTEGIRESLLNSKGLSPEKVLFLPNGVDTAIFQPRPEDRVLKQSLGLGGKQIVLYAGNHGYAGAVEQVLYAADRLRDRSSFHFLFVGDGPEKKNLIQMADELSLPNVSFHKPVPLEVMPAFISISDVAVVTLRRSRVMAGARPAKLFVMMSSGKPIVLSGEREPAQLIESARSGVVVPPEDDESLAAAIQGVLEDRAQAEELGKNGRAFVVANFQWSSLVGSWLSQLSGRARRSAHPEGKFKHAEKGIDTPLIRD